MCGRPIEQVGSNKGIALQIVQYVAPCLQEPVPLLFDRGCIVTDQLKVGSLNLNRCRFSSSGRLRTPLPFAVAGNALQRAERVVQARDAFSRGAINECLQPRGSGSDVKVGGKR